MAAARWAAPMLVRLTALCCAALHCIGVVRVRFDEPVGSDDGRTPSASTAAGAVASTSASGLPSADPLLASAAAKRAVGGSAISSNARTFPRYALHSRQMGYGPRDAAALGNGGARRPTATNDLPGQQPAAIDEEGGGGRSPSSAPIAAAFNTSPFAPSAAQSAASQPQAPLGGTATAVVDPFSGGAKKFDMVAAENDAILLALFVAPRTPATAAAAPSTSSASRVSSEAADSDLAARLLAAFHSQFHPLLTQLHSTFLHMAKSPEDALQDESLLPHFAAFERSLREVAGDAAMGGPAVAAATAGAGEAAARATSNSASSPLLATSPRMRPSSFEMQSATATPPSGSGEQAHAQPRRPFAEVAQA